MDSSKVVEGTVLSSTYQSTESPLLSTLYEPLPQHLISVLGMNQPTLPVDQKCFMVL